MAGDALVHGRILGSRGYFSMSQRAVTVNALIPTVEEFLVTDPDCMFDRDLFLNLIMTSKTRSVLYLGGYRTLVFMRQT